MRGRHAILKATLVFAAWLLLCCVGGAAFAAKWGQFVIDPGFFTRLVYEGF